MEFKVGDKIRIKNCLSVNDIVINRVTKTQAMADVFNEDGSKRYTYKFRKEYDIWNKKTMSIWVTPIPRIEWNTNSYFLIK